MKKKEKPTKQLSAVLEKALIIVKHILLQQQECHNLFLWLFFFKTKHLNAFFVSRGWNWVASWRSFRTTVYCWEIIYFSFILYFHHYIYIYIYIFKYLYTMITSSSSSSSSSSSLADSIKSHGSLLLSFPIVHRFWQVL